MINLVTITVCGYILGVSSSYISMSSYLDARQHVKSGMYILPNKKLVDHIYNQADCKIPFRPQSNLFRPQSFLLEGCHLSAGYNKSILRDGCLYGGRYSNGRIVQRYSCIHSDGYRDYSQGIRLIYRYAYDTRLKAWVNTLDLFNQNNKLECINVSG